MLFGDTIRKMFRVGATLLSLLFAGAPSVADYCAVSCETAHVGDAFASSAHAGHHHHPPNTLSTALHSIGQAPQPCGHDHHNITAVTASSAARARLLTPVSAAVLPASLPAPSRWTSVADLHSSNSPPGPSLRGFASPIRI